MNYTRISLLALLLFFVAACQKSDDDIRLTIQLSSDNDYALNLKDSTVNIPVLANDSITHGEAFSLSIKQAALHGTVAFSNETLIYTPNPNYTGLDSVQYQITTANDTSTSWAYIATTELLKEIAVTRSSEKAIQVSAKAIDGITFNWYDAEKTLLNSGNNVIINMSADSTIYVEGKFNAFSTGLMPVFIPFAPFALDEYILDLRLSVCPQVGFDIDLKNYMSIVNPTAITITPKTSIPISGTVVAGADLVAKPQLHAFTYSVQNINTKYEGTIYLSCLKSSTIPNIPSRVMFCKSSGYINLKQLLGLEVNGGTWAADPTLTPVGNFITTTDGAYVFNTTRAWNESKGIAEGANRLVTFTYTIPASAPCLPSKTYSLAVVLTEDITTFSGNFYYQSVMQSIVNSWLDEMNIDPDNLIY